MKGAVGGLAVLWLALVAGFAAVAFAADRQILIGTAGVTGVYYPAGGAICRLLNRSKKEHGIHCSATSSQGSVNNLEAIANHKMDFAVVQSDWQSFATQNKDAAFSDLRSVFSLHTEPFTVMVRADSAIESWDDLRGKRVNVGPREAGVWRTVDAVLEAKGWKKQAFSRISNVRWEDQGKALCDKEVDAIMMTIGHPNANLQQVVHKCDVRLIGLEPEVIQKIISERPYFVRAAIQGGMYPGNPTDIQTFGVKATVMTSAQTDEKVVYELVRSVFENLNNFKTLHPVFSMLNQKRMERDGLTAPLHPGAQRYFSEIALREAGAANNSSAAKR